MSLLRRAVLAAAIVAAVLTAVPTAGAAAVIVRDPVGDVALGGGDLRSAGAVFQDGMILLSATVAEGTANPFADGPWADPATGITWFLSGPSGDDLFSVTFRSAHSATSTALSSEVTRLSDGALVCLGYGTGSTWGTYQTRVTASCVPGLERFRAVMTYSAGGVMTSDAVPDHGHSPVVAESGPAIAPLGHVVPADVRSGYWAISEDGTVYAFGDVRNLGDVSSTQAVYRSRAADIDVSFNRMGYWILTDGGYPYFCRAGPWECSDRGPGVVAGALLRPPPLLGVATSLSANPAGTGAWIFTSRGEVVTYGDAGRFGDLTALNLNSPIVDSVATPSGQGYYMVAADGGVFSFGDAHFAGSMGDKKLNAPVKALVPDSDGSGYWLVAADGGIFAFDAPFKGSMGDKKLNKPVRGMIRYGDAYLMVAEDGGIFNFSTQPFAGSLGATPPASPVVSVTSLNLPDDTDIQ